MAHQQEVGSPGTASAGESQAVGLTGEIVLDRLAQAVQQLALSSSGGSSNFRESKFVRQPDIFDPKDLEQELTQWGDWAFRFKAFMMIQDPRFNEDLAECEVATAFVAFNEYAPDRKERAVRLYAMLASYLRGRPLKLLRSVKDSNGFAVWRQLRDELAPRTRPRTLALAQALTRFPAYKEGTSILEYILTYERLVRDYESISANAYAEDLKIGTLLSGLPSEMRRFLQMQVTDSASYESLRERVLQYERSSSSWSADHVLRSLGVDRPQGSDGPVPMEVDRLELKGDRSGWGKHGKHGGGKPKGPNSVCFVRGKPGHFAAECRHRVNQVQESEVASTVASTSTAPTSATTLAAKSQPKARVQRIDLSDLDLEEDGLEITYFNEEIRAVTTLDEPFDVRVEEELKSTSSLWYQMSSDEDEELEVAVRTLVDTSVHEVILDSGADCTVLPFDHFGHVGLQSARTTTLLDAQGNHIPQGASREQVMFEVEGCDGETIQFVDNAILARVRQPLFCFGKLLRSHWKPVQQGGDWFLQKGDSKFNVHWSKNSLATLMRISRVASEAVHPAEPEQDSHPNGGGDPVVLRLRMVLAIDEHLELHTKDPGWSLSSEGYPVHLGVAVGGTLDASERFDPEEWPLRWTFLWRGGSDYEVFEGGEFWGPDELGGNPKVLKFEEKEKKVLTVLTKEFLDFSVFGKVVEGEPPAPRFPRNAIPPVSKEDQNSLKLGEEQVEVNVPMIGPVAMEIHGQSEEAVQVNGVPLTELSSLKDPRTACRFLGVSKNGAKSAVWQRLKKEVMMAKLRASVEASEEVQKQYEREPLLEALPKPPEPHLVALHEITHMPRAAWCEACVATRSREDNYADSQPKREHPVISVDFMFTKTDGQDQPLATHLVCVDSQTKYVHVIALEGKGGNSLKYATKEIVKMTSALGYSRVSLRHDTEPSMKQLAEAVQSSRMKMGLATNLEPVAPEASAHGALHAERYIDTVRRMGNCLLETLRQRTGHKVESKDPLFAWAFVHAGFLISRFSVHKDGCTSHELVHGRPYVQKLCPFGSAVYAQVLPRNKNKGEPWKQFVWLGRSDLGQLHVLGGPTGIQFSRTVRRAPKEYDLQLLKSMKGVPWDFSLEAVASKKGKVSYQRTPVLLDGPLPLPPVEGPGPDEAASDPASVEGGTNAAQDL